MDARRPHGLGAWRVAEATRAGATFNSPHGLGPGSAEQRDEQPGAPWDKHFVSCVFPKIPAQPVLRGCDKRMAAKEAPSVNGEAGVKGPAPGVWQSRQGPQSRHLQRPKAETPEAAPSQRREPRAH